MCPPVFTDNKCVFPNVEKNLQQNYVRTIVFGLTNQINYYQINYFYYFLIKFSLIENSLTFW